jgi:uncharacterized delta-60 repeat protein
LDSAFGNAGVATAHFTGFASSTAVGAVIQPDGKIVVAGSAIPQSELIGNSFALARFNAFGTLDRTFGTGGEVTTVLGQAAGVVLQADGKIVVGGTSNANTFAVARYKTDGSLDNSFGSGGTVTTSVDPKGNTVTTVLLQPDGKIVLVGFHHQSSPDFSTTELVRYNTDGTLDAGFGNSGTVSNISGTPGTAALQSDGSIVIPETSGTTFSSWFLVRIHVDGSQDQSFTPIIDFGQGNNEGLGVAIQADGKIVTTGMAGQPAMARLNLDRRLDTTFGINGKVFTPVSGKLAIQSDGRILVTGYTNGTSGSGGLARYMPNGTLDSGFGIDGSASGFPSGLGSGLALQPDGNILVTGSFVSADSSSADLAIARYLGGPSPVVTGTLNQRFVQQIYLDVLQRPADAGGLAFWTSALASGQSTRTQVVLSIEQSAEYHALVVQNLYNLYFHRAADSAGITAWSDFLANGGTTGQLRAILLGSDEYARNHSGGNGSLTFLEGVYHDVLYRSIDSGGQATWTQAQNNGASNEAIAAAIIRSTEGAGDEVQDLYQRLLHRAPDATGLSAFTSALQNNVSDEVVLATIAGSDEYAAQL